MVKLIYSVITSLDGYVNDASGCFDWAAPDEDVHAFVNDLERTVGSYLYGRRMYEVMVAWETLSTGPTGPGEPAVIRDYAEIRFALELLDERRFASGVVHLHYRVKNEERG